MRPLDDIKSAIASACAHSKRKTGDVTLVAVSKNRDASAITALIEQGQKHFGENRIQEAAEKWHALRAAYPGIILHFIGHLQTNKAGEAVALFDRIDSIDSPRLADALAREMQKQNRRLPCLIQVNTGEEPQKGGVAPQDLPALLDHCRHTAKLDIRGLLCIPPEGAIPDFHFALLRKLAKRHGLETLSMGMSTDFSRAIAFGATEIRIGSALFKDSQ